MLRIGLVNTKSGSIVQSIFVEGKDAAKPGELLWVDHENKVRESYFKEFTKQEIERRVEEIMQNRKYAGQMLGDELEFTKVSEHEYTSNYSIKIKKFKKGALISDKDPEPFETYFKEALERTELSQPSVKQTGTPEDILMWHLLKEISIDRMKMKEQKIKMNVTDKYPLNYSQLLLLFQFLSFMSPDISKALEFVSHPNFKIVGFPLELTINIYLDVVAHMSLKNLVLESPKDELMTLSYSPNEKNEQEDMKITEQKKNETPTDNAKTNFVDMTEEDCMDNMTEAAEGKNCLKDFATHCDLNTKTLSNIRRTRSKSTKPKINYFSTITEEKKTKHLHQVIPLKSVVLNVEERGKKGFRRTMTARGASDITAHTINHSTLKINLQKKDLLRLFRFSIKNKAGALQSKVKDVDVKLFN
jgi:hypothetical protein